MNFQRKNFQYVKKPFGDFITDCTQGAKQYMRSLSAERPADQPASFSDDFPELRNDFHLPEQLASVARNEHSSPFRISGPVNMWLHYDVSCNHYPSALESTADFASRSWPMFYAKSVAPKCWLSTFLQTPSTSASHTGHPALQSTFLLTIPTGAASLLILTRTFERPSTPAMSCISLHCGCTPQRPRRT